MSARATGSISLIQRSAAFHIELEKAFAFKELSILRNLGVRCGAALGQNKITRG
jgi:hypothetical protein